MQLDVAVLAGENALIVVVDRDCQHLFGGILADDILVKACLDLSRRQDVDAFQRVIVVVGTGLRRTAAAIPGRHTGARRGRALAILIQGVAAHIQAVFADVDTGADDQLLHLILRASAEAADELASFSVLTGRLICHVVPPNQCL